MELNPLPQDPETLFIVAEEIADFLGEQRTELGISKDAEALLRASIAAATSARSAYLAILAGADESADARRFLAPARTRSEQTERQLRHRLASVIAAIAVPFNECA